MTAIAALVFALGLAGGAQTSAGLPHFDVISIRPVPRPRIRHPYAAARAVLPGGKYDDPYASLYDLFAFAYPDNTADNTLIGLPAWGRTSGTLFAVQAEASPNSTPRLAQMRLMMQSLLARRFGVKFHIEQRVMPVYLLEAVRGGVRNLKPSMAGERYEYPVTLLTIEFNGVTARAVTMREIASRLAVSLNRPVLDRTGVAGSYDIDVPRPDRPLPGAPHSEESFSAALRNKLGLKLVSGKSPVPAMVIDQVHRPTPN